MGEWEVTVFTLPSLPPPLYACFTNVARNGRASTPVYRDWTMEALWAIKAQRVKPVQGNVTVHYQMQRPSRRKMDLGNREKGLSDLLVKAGVIEDDSRIIDLRLSWGGEHPVTVTVLPAVDDLRTQDERNILKSEGRARANGARPSNQRDPYLGESQMANCSIQYQCHDRNTTSGDVDDWDSAFGDLKPKRFDHLRHLLNTVCEEHGITIEQMRGPQRQRVFIAARKDFCRRAYEVGRWSTVQIGRAIDRDHSTVLFHIGHLSCFNPKKGGV